MMSIFRLFLLFFSIYNYPTPKGVLLNFIGEDPRDRKKFRENGFFHLKKNVEDASNNHNFFFVRQFRVIVSNNNKSLKLVFTKIIIDFFSIFNEISYFILCVYFLILNIELL